jgi:hypothetical protein
LRRRRESATRSTCSRAEARDSDDASFEPGFKHPRVHEAPARRALPVTNVVKTSPTTGPSASATNR